MKVELRRDRIGGVFGERNGARIDATTGFLHASVRATRTGVFLYRRKDGSISRELRHPEDVFEPGSLESLKRVVATKGHPTEFVTADNVKRLQVGHAGDDIRRESIDGYDHPTVGLTVTDKDVVRSIVDHDRSMVSMGYSIELVEESGEFNGEAYDRRHTKIRYNHVAVDIDQGRGGRSVNIKLDGVDAELLVEDQDENEPDHEPENRIDSSMKVKIKIDGVEVELDAQIASIVKDALEKRDAKIDALTDDAKTKADEADAVQAKLDAATTELEDVKKKADSVDVGAAARELLEVLDQAGKFLELDDEAGEGTVRDGLLALDSVAAIRKAAVMAKLGDAGKALEKKSDAYFEARFDAFVEASGKSDDDETKTDSTGELAKAVHTAGKPKKGGKKADEADVEKDVADALDFEDPAKLVSAKHHITSPAAQA